MGSFVEMATGIGKEDPSYGYAAFRPPLEPVHVEALLNRLTQFNEATDLDGTTEIVMRNHNFRSVAWINFRAVQAHGYLKDNGYSVRWLNPGTGNLLQVSGPESLFELMESQGAAHPA